jgi:hypothetical protein
MDLDSDYYSSSCKDINGLRVFKMGLLWCLWVRTLFIKQTVFFSKIKELLEFWGGDASPPTPSTWDSINVYCIQTSVLIITPSPPVFTLKFFVIIFIKNKELEKLNFLV